MRAVLFDLDGVIYQNGKAIDGAVATLNWVREQSIPYLFVTNTTSRPLYRIANRLQDYGLRWSERASSAKPICPSA